MDKNKTSISKYPVVNRSLQLLDWLSLLHCSYFSCSNQTYVRFNPRVSADKFQGSLHNSWDLTSHLIFHLFHLSNSHYPSPFRKFSAPLIFHNGKINVRKFGGTTLAPCPPPLPSKKEICIFV